MLNISLLTLIIYTVLLILIIVLLVMVLTMKKRFKRRLIRILEEYNIRIREYEEEIKRLNYIISEYKAKLKISGKEVDVNVNNLDVNELLLQKQELERERQHLKEKTKRLWEQSLAIHKEKERIDQLRREIEARHKEMVDSVNYASRIQAALLPKKEFLQHLFKEYFVLWLPKQIVSGDFYWVKKIQNRLFIVGADCTGHGVPGAFMSLLGISFLEQIISASPWMDAAQILEQMRIHVMNALQQSSASETKDGMDMALVIVETNTKNAQFAGANNPAYLVRDNQLIEFKPTKNPIGIYFRQRPFEKIDFQLQENDVIYLFSDGYADQFNGETGRKLTKKRFKKLLLDMNTENIPVSQQGKFLEQFIRDWMGQSRQIDDIMVFGIKF